RGETTEAGPPLGRLVVGSWDELRRMTVALRSRWPRLAPSIAAAIAPYLPAGRSIPPITVRFHLGGQWDGRTFGEVYVNLSFFQARGPDSLEGLDALLVHEVFHQAQADLLPGVEDYSSPQSCLFYAFLRIEQEGIARHLEYRYLREHAPDTSLDRTNFEKYRDGLRHAAENAGMLGQLLEAASHHDLRRARLLIDEGFTAGGPLYAVGHSMALRIDRRLGAGALRGTVATGPIAFFRTYAAAVRAGGEPTILPAGTMRAVEEVARGYGRHSIEATHLRRRGLRLIEEGRLEKAVAALRRACRLDPSDAVSAYNLACARALQGRSRAALHWLERSVGRGFDDARLLRTDPDLDTVRDDDGFRRLLLRMIRPAGGATRSPPPGDGSEEIGP
ncbi:MAG TPA: DUF5700 domain-containing putative Zn-dependent protease, partial [Candidatus Polarisedimenticolia bacterium]|nr:DUF5700 domain-containing putative Zn-dependent protease [Candidatus Polarisedimenticolia bacterium]